MAFRWFGDFILCETQTSNHAVREMPTAIFSTYTSEGWVIATDGLGSDQITTDNDVQKLFPIKGRPLAYTLLGSTKLLKNEKVTVDLSLTVAEAAHLLNRDASSDSIRLLKRLCQPTYNALRAAKRRNKIRYPDTKEVPPDPGSTILWVFLSGYIKDRPIQADCRIFHRNQSLDMYDPRPQQICLGWGLRHGPSQAWKMLENLDDHTFSAYQTSLPPPEQITLAQGIESAKNHIGVCSDPRAREIAPETCSKIGGRIQIATITPDEGFRWVPGFEPAGKEQ